MMRPSGLLRMLTLLTFSAVIPAISSSTVPAPAQEAQRKASPPPGADIAPAPAPSSRLVLSDFGSAGELARFARRGIEASHFTPVPNGSGGGTGARVVFVKYRPGGMEWPALILRTDKGLPADWGGYDALAVDIQKRPLPRWT